MCGLEWAMVAFYTLRPAPFGFVGGVGQRAAGQPVAAAAMAAHRPAGSLNLLVNRNPRRALVGACAAQ